MNEQNRPENASRRTFLSGSITAAVAAAAAGMMRPSLADAQSTSAPPKVDLSRGGKVQQITMVVKDAERVAKRFSDVFGPSWTFYEFRPKQIVLHDKDLGGADCVLKLAIGDCGGHSFKLVQPVSGQNSYAEFLQKQGEGFYAMGLGAFPNHDQMLAAFKNAGAGVEMQGDVGNGSKFTILETVEDLGLRVEFDSVPKQAVSANLRQTGSFTAKGPGIIDMNLPVISGGRRFVQLGIIVKDEKKSARRYEELLGIGGWQFQPIPTLEYTFNGKKIAEADLPSTTVGQGGAYLGDTQIELLAPVAQGPGGTHKAFLDKHGNGFQHLMISPAAGDHDAVVDALLKAGMKKEIEATIKLGNMIGHGDYIGMQEQVGGFVLEFNG